MILLLSRVIAWVHASFVAALCLPSGPMAEAARYVLQVVRRLGHGTSWRGPSVANALIYQ